jgi:hypothetical protein
MSIVITTEDVSKASDDQLMREASNPTGVLGPAFLVLAEIEKRRMARDRSPKKDMPSTTVQQDIVTGLNALPQAGMSAAGRDVMPQMQPQMMPPQMMPPQMPSQPMADGGLVAFQEGGLTTAEQLRLGAPSSAYRPSFLLETLEYLQKPSQGERKGVRMSPSGGLTAAEEMGLLSGDLTVSDIPRTLPSGTGRQRITNPKYQEALEYLQKQRTEAGDPRPVTGSSLFGLQPLSEVGVRDPNTGKFLSPTESLTVDTASTQVGDPVPPSENRRESMVKSLERFGGSTASKLQFDPNLISEGPFATEEGIAARKRKEEELREIPKTDKDKIGSKLLGEQYSAALEEMGDFSFSTSDQIKEARDKAAKKYRDDRENPFKVFESAIKDARKERDNIKKNNFNDALINAGAAILQAPGGKNLQWLGKGLGALQKKFEEGRSMLRDANKELRTSQMAKAQAEELRRQGEEAAADKAEARERAADDRRYKIMRNKVAMFAAKTDFDIKRFKAESDRIQANTQNLFYKQAVAGIGKSLPFDKAMEIAREELIRDTNINLKGKAFEDEVMRRAADLVRLSQTVTNPFGAGQGLSSLRTAPQDIDVSNNPDLLNLLLNPVPVDSGRQ